MIATIIATVLILPIIIWLIVGLLKKNIDWEDYTIACLITLFVCVPLLWISLVFGYRQGDPVRRASIEEALSLGSRLAVHDAIEYNEDLREDDNYFCRFTLRPGSDYIDVTFYENKQGETK